MKPTAKRTYILSGTVFLLSCGAPILSSCSQEETPVDIPDGGDRRIVFHTSLPTLTTRATEVVSDLTKFYLTVYDETDKELRGEDGKLREFYDLLEIEKEAGASSLSSDLCVWPEPGQESDLLHFFAYYPQELPAPTNATSAEGDKVTVGYRIEDFTVASDIAEQVDFVTAYATGSMALNLFSGIDLNFRHQLCRVEVMAKGSHKSCDIEIAGLSIGQAVMQGTFDFQTSSDQTSSDADGKWTPISKYNATYIFREGDAVVTTGADPVSIMGSKIDEANDNCAMLIPSTLSAWDYANDRSNGKAGLYLNVLLRIIDKTPTSNKGKQQYPYYDNSQGLNALNVPIVLLAVDTDGKVTANLGEFYKDGEGRYYTDRDKTVVYEVNVPDGITAKEFGWAALPISGDWEPGKVYTYTLDYTYGIGVHGPEVSGDTAPRAGDPIISDRVGVSLDFKDWTTTNPTGVPVPGN